MIQNREEKTNQTGRIEWNTKPNEELVKKIINKQKTLEKYREITLCEECIHRVREEDPAIGKFYWCRNDEGLDGSIGEYDGCSRGLKL